MFALPETKTVPRFLKRKLRLSNLFNARVRDTCALSRGRWEDTVGRFSFHHEGPRDLTQVVQLISKWPWELNLLSSPVIEP